METFSPTLEIRKLRGKQVNDTINTKGSKGRKTLIHVCASPKAKADFLFAINANRSTNNYISIIQTFYQDMLAMA